MGVDASAAACALVCAVSLQGIGYVGLLQSTGSGTLNAEHPAAGRTPGTLSFSIGCQATTVQNRTGLLRWVWLGRMQSWRLMLELLPSHGRVGAWSAPG